MLTQIANGDSRLSLWLRVREFAVPAPMIETATARRLAGDWAGACAAAGVDVDLHLRAVARTHGQELAARVRADLRQLAPDLLRWHLPRIAPHGLLRPGLTITLARYGGGRAGPLHLVVRTPPAWADAGQRVSLALRDGAVEGGDVRRHPHPLPNRRFRLDLHRHLWDASRAGELRVRAGVGSAPDDCSAVLGADALPEGHRCAVGRWAAEATILLGAASGSVLVRCGGRRRLLIEPAAAADGPGPPVLRIAAAPAGGTSTALPVLPDAATWVLPDLELIRAGLIEPDQLHPLVATALVPGHSSAGPPRVPDEPGRPRVVDCRGARHRIGLVDGALAALDHEPAEVRREELLAALSGTPLPCLQAIDEAHRHPDCLSGVRERLHHGDIAGALAVVEGLLGPEAVLRSGALRDELETAARRRVAYGLFRAGLAEPRPRRLPPAPRTRGARSGTRAGRSRPRQAEPA